MSLNFVAQATVNFQTIGKQSPKANVASSDTDNDITISSAVRITAIMSKTMIIVIKTLCRNSSMACSANVDFNVYIIQERDLLR